MKLRNVIAVALVCIASAATARTQGEPAFPPLERWKAAVLSGDANRLKSVYTTSPAAQFQNMQRQPMSLQSELEFWRQLKHEGLSKIVLDVAQVGPGNVPGSEAATFEAELTLASGAKSRTEYVLLSQIWTGGADPKIFAQMRSPVRRLKQPLKLAEIYHSGVDARAEIGQALAHAAAQHKRVLLVFGGNWCYDCHVLKLAFQHPDIRPTLAANYIVVDVDVGEYNRNLDIAKQYGVPLDKGVPALVVLGSDGSVIFNQPAGLTAARSLSPEDILAFLNKWRPVS